MMDCKNIKLDYIKIVREKAWVSSEGNCWESKDIIKENSIREIMNLNKSRL
jgi:hypothetical protein